MEKKIKHLEFIQDTIKRMAGNSFLLRGWSITILIAIVTIGSQAEKPLHFFWIASCVAVIFWLLDSYYLHQERKYRCLYEDVRKKRDDDIDFSMKTLTGHCSRCDWFSAFRSKIFLVFYGLLLVALLGVILFSMFNISFTLR